MSVFLVHVDICGVGGEGWGVGDGGMGGGGVGDGGWGEDTDTGRPVCGSLPAWVGQKKSTCFIFTTEPVFKVTKVQLGKRAPGMPSNKDHPRFIAGVLTPTGYAPTNNWIALSKRSITFCSFDG